MREATSGTRFRTAWSRKAPSSPGIGTLEVTNVLLVAERRQRLRQAESANFLRLLGSFAITVQPQRDLASLAPVLELARRHTLSSYDATYLELAAREGLALATLDERLMRAARGEGVRLLE